MALRAPRRRPTHLLYMRWRRTNISQLPCTQKIGTLLGGPFHSGAPRLCLPCLPCRDATEWQAHHGECHENVYYPKKTLSPKGRFCHACLFLDAINALTRLPLPECDARIKVRLGFLVWFDFHSEVLRVARHTVGPLFSHFRWITEQPPSLKIWLLRRWREAEPLPFYLYCPRMCMVLYFSDKMCMLPFSLLIANGSLRRHGPWWIIVVLSSVGNVHSWKRARSVGFSSVRSTPELPVHVVLVPPLLVPSSLVPPLLRFQALVMPLLRLQALVPMVQRQPHRVCYFLDCPRKFRLRPLWWLHKSSGFYSCRPPHCPCRRFFSRFFAAPKAYKRGRLSNGYTTMKLNKTPFSYCNRHNWQLCINQYSLRYFLIMPITEYLKNQNKNSHSHADCSLCSLSACSFNCSYWVKHSARERLGSTTSKNAAAQQAQGTPLFVLLFRHCEIFGALALVCWHISCSTQWLRELHVEGLGMTIIMRWRPTSIESVAV